MAKGRRIHDLERRAAVAESLRDILTALNTDRSLPEILDFIIGQAGRLLGTEIGCVWQFHDSGEYLTIAAGRGLPLEQMAHLRLQVGQGAVGQAIALRRPIPVTDMPAFFQPGRVPMDETSRSHVISDYGAVLAVPLMTKGQVYGGIVLYYREPRQFSEEEISLAMTYASQAALAIENARLRTQAERAAVAAERNRLARDLHDAVTQTLFSTSLIAEVLPVLWERNPAEGRRRLSELRELTRGALAEMRNLLLELRPTALVEAKMGDLLRQLADAITGRARIPVTLRCEGEAKLPPDVQVALYRIAQEALNNVARHAGATAAGVT
ncbi:MAG TPA: GAF domain-containing protein, partial [Symbiobacteriaceae bacterium]|nr:GAF domain-containing protein [Symbiobacteriaceae bacterium]